MPAMHDALLDHPVISERYFFPGRVRHADAFVVDVGDAELACWHAPARAGERTFVHFHGNGEVVADYLPDYAAAIRRLGMGVFLVGYRGYGGSSGTPQLGRMLADVPRVVRALGRPETELVVYGRSVGSIFAIELARRHPNIAGLVIESGIYDVLERLLLRLRPEELGVSPATLAAEVDSWLNHAAKLGGYTGPLLVMHARDDQLVDPSHAERNYDAAASERKRIAWFEHGGHNALMTRNWPAYLDALRRFVAGL